MAISNPELKKLAAIGIAKDITNAKLTRTQIKRLNRILTVKGTYGMSGALYVSPGGKLYVVIGRVPNLFALG